MRCVLCSTRGQLGTERDGEGQEGGRIKDLMEIDAKGNEHVLKS